MSATEKQNAPVDVYQIVTDRIIEQLENSVVPWRKPWTQGGHPQNLFTRRHYSGINTWLLASLGYEQNFFLTWKQLKAVGASVRKGEKGTIVVFWKRLPEPEGDGDGKERKARSVLRYYYVFNVAQIDGLPEVVSIPCPEHGISSIGACDEILERMPNCPEIRHGRQKAFYDPEKDYINMPRQGSFSPPSAYYSTLFHELVHSTGHASRLGRKEVTEPSKYGSEKYGMEELVAEIGACYLNSVAGIENAEFDSSVAYIRGWIEVLKNDRRMIVLASCQAQRAVDYILNVRRSPEGEEAAVLESETQ